MRPVFCGNFEYDARESDLERLFRKYGKVERVDMKAGFAFVYMEDERDAEDAIRALDRVEFGRKGRRLRVEWTKNERGGPRQSGGSRRSSSGMRPSKTLFVINFDVESTRTRDLERHFEPYGKIANLRIRRNFAFVQYESQEDATRALESTNMSKMMDRVISVEYAVKDDDVRGNGHSPERRRDRSPDRKRRSPSPYRRERGSPDYGRGSSPGGAYRKERGSPDYGRGRRPSPDYGRKEKDDRHRGSESPRRRERERSPHSRSPYKREKVSPKNGDARDHSPYGRERDSSPRHGHRNNSRSPFRRERSSPENGQVVSPGSARGHKDSRDYDGAESPNRERYNRSV
ncbi:PREDICTED: serine/arginine-rich splicing factor RS40-like isoform X2 [Tarenaya hassleriana]|uniref:serine/arginine-rich splicing factor RS40-like isoform X2 n=1 Tax=Tarenaya hassleriana TaxID=28532 RepID=UPI00053C1086|nr:PREDICTED: serine/arginine-rich splicing factor RS40-like isoform X2 [Tarenaya hassleriana]